MKFDYSLRTLAGRGHRSPGNLARIVQAERIKQGEVKMEQQPLDPCQTLHSRLDRVWAKMDEAKGLEGGWFDGQRWTGSRPMAQQREPTESAATGSGLDEL